MHLGGENKTFRYIVLIPYIAFMVYLIAMVDIGEGGYSKEHREVMDRHYKEKPIEHHEGGASHEAAHHE
jgi:hypothetical protein